MNCGTARRLLSIRREWAPEEGAAAEAHLAACPACRAVAREYELMDRRLGRLPEPALAPAALRAPALAGQPPTPSRRVLPAVASLVVMGLVLLAAVGLGAGRSSLPLPQIPAVGPRPGTLPAPAATPATLGFTWPLSGTLTQTYWAGHQALDIASPLGSPIHAAAAGVVLLRDRDGENGNFVLIEHDGGYETFYSHLGSISVEVGEEVAQGQQIGQVGLTGKTTGPHLHFEIRHDGERLSPWAVIPGTPPAGLSLAPESRVGAGTALDGYGIQVHMIDQDPIPIVDAVQELGVGWVKQQINWADVEPRRGDFEWQQLDRLVETIDAAGLDLLLNIVGSPRWAWSEGAEYEVMGPPADPADFAHFVGELAARYQGRVGAYEIWQEQNLHYAWGDRTLDAGEYVSLLRTAYESIKANDPTALVISGGLTPAPHVAYSSKMKAVDEYLREMYAAGLIDACDAVGAHLPTYNLPPDADWQHYEDPSARFRGPFESRDPSWSFQATAEEYRRVMIAKGDSRPLWITEFGWAVSADPPEHWQYASDNTRQEQAEYTLEAVTMARNWGWVEAIFLWNLNLAVVAPESEKAMWSIVASNWERTGTFEALADELIRIAAEADMAWPVAGTLSQTYWAGHQALDIAGPLGSPVHAVADGSVVDVGYDAGYGKFILLDHSDGYASLYAHLASGFVEIGEEVDRHQKIGQIGETGKTNGPHLHFELLKDGERLNPLDYLP